MLYHRIVESCQNISWANIVEQFVFGNGCCNKCCCSMAPKLYCVICVKIVYKVLFLLVVDIVVEYFIPIVLVVAETWRIL